MQAGFTKRLSNNWQASAIVLADGPGLREDSPPVLPETGRITRRRGRLHSNHHVERGSSRSGTADAPVNFASFGVDIYDEAVVPTDHQ